MRAPEAGADRVERQPEADDERCPPELRHAYQLFFGVYFDGHFVTIVPGIGDEDAVREAALDDDVAAGAEQVGHEPL